MRDNDKILRLNTELQKQATYSQKLTQEIVNVEAIIKFSQEKGYPCFAVKYFPGGSSLFTDLVSTLLTDLIKDENYALLEKVTDEMHRKRRGADEEIVRLMKEIQAEMEGKPKTKKVHVMETLVYNNVEVPADLYDEDLEDYVVDKLVGHEEWHVEDRHVVE